MKITNENYFSAEANKEYMGVSQFKSFLKCEAQTMAELNGEYEKPDKTALLVGQYVHSWSEGTLEKFKTEHPEIISSKGKTKGKLKREFCGAEECINTLKDDPRIQIALTGKKEVCFTAELFGVPWKILIDCYNPKAGIFTDLKVMKDIYSRYWLQESDGGYWTNFVEYYQYHVQMAIYAEIERLANNRDNYLEPHIVCVTKQSPPDKMILKGFVDEIPHLLSQVEEKLPHIIEVKNGLIEPKRCERCEYCRSIKKAEVMDYHYLI